MRVAIHQPNFLPRLKVLQKIAAADMWVVLDSVQYCSREWQNRTRIVSLHGDYPSHWLSIPVYRPEGQQTRIKDVRILNPTATVRLIKHDLIHAFRRSEYWNSLQGILSGFDSALASATLTGACVELTITLLNIANINPAVIYASSLVASGKSSGLMASICNVVGADGYLADSGAQAYLRSDDFKGIKIMWQNWVEPKEQWPGIYSWRDISGINYLFREGPAAFRNHLLDCHFAPGLANAVAHE